MEREAATDSLPPFWSEKEALTIQKQKIRGFLCSLTNSFVKDRPAPVLGGVLADEMGLGKTLEILSLIAQGQKGSTLLVCPASLIQNWSQQAAEHCPSLTVRIHHGPERDMSLKAIAKDDLVITTYQTLASEYAKKTGLFAVSWLRVVLDEAHTIRNMTLSSQKLMSLTRRYSWAVTGTPIQNRVEDFQALLELCKVDPLMDPTFFQRCIVKPLKAGDPAALGALRVSNVIDPYIFYTFAHRSNRQSS